MSAKASRKLTEYGHVLYRIYTEDANRRAVIRALQNAKLPSLGEGSSSGFTLIPAVGYGEGQDGNMESSLVCDVVVPYTHETDNEMCRVAEEIRKNNHNQTLLLVVRVPCFPERIWNREITNQGQGAFQFAGEEKQQVRCALEPQKLACRKITASDMKTGKIVASAGTWKKLLTKAMQLQPGVADEIKYTSSRENQSMTQAIAHSYQRNSGGRPSGTSGR